MDLVDRVVRRACRGLDEGEVVVASLTGLEADGRRRRFVVVTDRRILVGWARGDAPHELPLDATDCAYEQPGGVLTLRQGDQAVGLRTDDRLAARAIVDLLANHQRQAETPASIPVPAVRILAG